METPEELHEKLLAAVAPGYRERLLAQGLARGMVWIGGVVPEGSPRFSTNLTMDLLDHGYTVLGQALRLKAMQRNASVLDDALRSAGEAIEAAVRRGDTQDEQRGFHLTVGAAAFHLAHLAARSYSLLEGSHEALNLSSVERLLVLLMRRRLVELDGACRVWLTDVSNNDEGVTDRLEDPEDEFDAGDASRVAVVRNFHRAIATFELALRTGEESLVNGALERLEAGAEAAARLRHVPLWWGNTLGFHLIDDLWDRSFHQRLPVVPDDDSGWNQIRRNYIEIMAHKDLAETDLWPSQLQAASRVVDTSDSLVVALPTSSGKTRIAELCAIRCLAGGKRVIYVTPLRALSAQVEISLSSVFRSLGYRVSSVYGASGIGAPDIGTIRDADIVVATPEKLDFAIRQAPECIDDVGLIVLDEGHMIGLSEREIRYEILVQRLLRRADSAERRLVCLSAIFGEGDAFDAFTGWIRQDQPGDAIRSDWRPTRQRPGVLEWRGDHGRLTYDVDGEEVFLERFVEHEQARGRRRRPFPNDRQELVIAAAWRFAERGLAALVYCPIRSSVESMAGSFLRAHAQGYFPSLLQGGAAADIEAAKRVGREWLGEDHVAVRALDLGVAVHHGSLPRPFLGELEMLLKRRVLPVAVSSPTLAQGVDLSFGVLIFNSLWRNRELIPIKEFANVVGRVGRAFIDIDGIFLLPVYEGGGQARRKRVQEFWTMVEQVKERELESGLLQLVGACLSLLKQKLGLSSLETAEYIVNSHDQVHAISHEEGDLPGLLRVVLAEMDAGILAMVENLDCPSDVVAEQLDQALDSSLWRRRLAVRSLEEQEAHPKVLKGRALWLWQRLDGPRRHGCFAAGVGMEAGEFIADRSQEFLKLIVAAEEAIDEEDVALVTDAVCSLAELLFPIYPFQPAALDSKWDPETWKGYIAIWVEGRALSEVGNPAGISFIQEGVVYRLVWGIESVRVTLEALGHIEPGSIISGRLALCLTYGVPSVPAALLLQAGLDSRLLACRLVETLRLQFGDHQALRGWVDSLTPDVPPLLDLSPDESASWARFVQRVRADAREWRRSSKSTEIAWEETSQPTPGTVVRVDRASDGIGVSVLSPDFELLGTADTYLPPGGVLTARVLPTRQVELTRFGPLPPRGTPTV